MANSAGGVQNGLVLRLSVPASGELAALGPELATRLAEQLGVTAADATQVASAVAGLTSEVRSPGAATVEFEFYKMDVQLTVRAHCHGRTAETRLPLNA
jgi:hypothetical protein